MRAQDSKTVTSLPLIQVLAYGAPGFPLAAATLPLFILIPTLYTQILGLNVLAVGYILIAVRFLDALSDPIFGFVSDRIATRWGLRKPWIAIGAPFLTLSLYKVLVPPLDATTTYLLVWSIVLTLSWTCLVLPYTAWGAEISTNYNERTRITSFREGLSLLGTMLIASVPACLTLLGYTDIFQHTRAIAFIVVIILPLCLLAALILTPSVPASPKPALAFRQSINFLLRNRPFHVLISAYFLNSLANGIPATLFVFYVTHVLQDPNAYGQLLFLYFGSAFVGIPLWLQISRRIGKRRAWLVAMLTAIAFFVWTPFLSGSAGLTVFTAIVLATGVTLGADLILPPSIQADVIDIDRQLSQQERAGLFFALWGISTKLALGFASGASLILLFYAGFDPHTSDQVGEPQPEAVSFLGVLYGLVPVLLKSVSIYVISKLEEPIPLTQD